MKRFYSIAMALAMALMLFNCEELVQNLDEDPTGNNGDDPVDYSAEQLVDSANTTLGETMTTVISGTADDPNNLDLSGVSTANQLFRMAIEKDPANSAANFGAGLTELLLILDSESAFMAEIQRWEAFLDTTTLFGEPYEDGGMGKIAPDQNQLITSNPLSLELSPEITAPAYLKAVTSLPKYAQSDLPQFSDWQNLIETEILDRIDFAISSLALVEADESFVFTITPEMQGNPSAPEKELDLTEVYLFDSILHGVQAICNMAIAYNVDLAPYDTTAFKTALATGGSFMTLRSGYESSMPTALDAIVGVFDKAKGGLDFLTSEQDDQSDDIVVLDGVASTDIDTAYLAIDSLKTAFSGPISIPTGDVDPNTQDPYMITVDISKLFDPAITDLKSLMPSYTVEAGVDTFWYYDTESEVHDYIVDGASAEVTFNAAGEYYFNYVKDYDSYMGYHVFEDDNNIEIQAFRDSVNNKLEALRTEHGNTLGWAGVGIDFDIFKSDTDEEGNPISYPVTETVTADIFIDYGLRFPEGIDYHPVIIWDADTYSDWIQEFDPTFGGVFPDFIQEDLEMLFNDMGMNAESWVKNMEEFEPVYTY